MEKSFEIVSTMYGNFLINEFDYIGDHIKTRENWEPHLYEFYSQILTKDDVCVDAGANLGYHAIQFGNLSKRVYAFEPQPMVFNQLCANILFNDLTFTSKFASLKFYNLLINSFTSYKILEDLELNIKKLIKFSIVWKGIKHDNIVYLFMYNNTNYTPESINAIGHEIIKRILFFNEFLNNNSYPDKFIIFLTDMKKEIDNELIEQIHFNSIHVNTAVTNTKDIIIYRKQELIKSIFHELIHFHNLDFRNISISNNILSKLINYIVNTHNIDTNNEYLIYESITETLANILNNIYYSGSVNEFKLNLKNEILFSTLQVSKILHICKYKQWTDFSKDNSNSNSKSKSKSRSKYKSTKKSKTKLKQKFTQDSCVFSYYILKLYILLQLDVYFKTILTNKLKFIETENSFNKLIEIFDTSRKNIVLEQIINSLLKSLNKKRKQITNKKTTATTNIGTNISTTLRMTCLESNIVL